MYVKVPDCFGQLYDNKNEVLKTNVPIYGTKHAARCFYKVPMSEVKYRKYEASKAYPCLYFIWKDGRLVTMVSWVDDIIALDELWKTLNKSRRI